MADETVRKPDDRAAIFDRLRDDMHADLDAPDPAAAAIVSRLGADTAPAPGPAPARAPAGKAGPRKPAVSYKSRPPLVRIALAWPVVIDGQAIAEVKLWPPVHDDVEAVVKGRMPQATMIARMAGMPDGFLSVLRFPDSDLVVSIAMVVAPDLFEAR